MATESTLGRCSSCGAQGPRDQMYGLEPELLCERCATGVRERLAPKAVGRLANVFGGKPTPLTALVLIVSAVLFVLVFLVYRNTPIADVPRWLVMLYPSLDEKGHWVGPWWQLITSALLHGGLIHVLFNSLWIWSLGRAVESTRGTAAFFLIFTLSAAFASAAQIFFADGAGIGLSGVLYALAGYLWMRRREDAVAATVMNPSTSRLLGTWFVICWFLPLGIGNWAHAGGLAWGLAAGWASTQPQPARYAGYAAVAVGTAFAIFWVATGHHA